MSQCKRRWGFAPQTGCNLQTRNYRAKPGGSPQLIQERLRLFQIGRVETFGEPGVDRREQIAGFVALALVQPQAGERGSDAQLMTNSRPVTEALL